MCKDTTLNFVLDFLKRLDSASISYCLSAPTGAMMVTVVIPGQRWEIEFHEDGEVGVEVFKSTGDIYGLEKIDQLFREFSD